MRAYQAGDVAAFKQLVQKYEKSLYSFCFRMLGQKTAAEDATQEIFLKLVRGHQQWVYTAKVKTWIYTIARNHCIDELRKAQNRPTENNALSLDKEDAGPLDLVDSATMSPERQAHSSHIRAKLIHAIKSLNAEQREVFLLREQAGLSFKQIADVIGASESTAKSRMRYAIERLRASLLRQGLIEEDAQV